MPNVAKQVYCVEPTFNEMTSSTRLVSTSTTWRMRRRITPRTVKLQVRPARIAGGRVVQLTTHTTTTSLQSSNTKTTVLPIQVRSIISISSLFGFLLKEVLTAYYAINSNVMKANNISGLFWGVNLSLTPGVRIHGKGTYYFEEEKSFI